MSHLPRGFHRWQVSHQLSNLPQAMAPIALTLATVSMEQSFNVGAALVTAMSLSQVVFAVPLGRLGDRLGARVVLRVMLLARALLIFTLMTGIAFEFDPYVLIALAAGSGAASGAIHGSYRTLLSDIVPAEQLPRALAVAATTGEVVFVGGPVLASALNAPGSVLPIGVMAAVLLAAALLLPAAGSTVAHRSVQRRRGSIPPVFLVWLICALAMSSAVGLVEVGAVTIALDLGMPARLGAVFAVTLCLASVTGGLLTTWLGPPSTTAMIVGMLSTTLAGAACVGLARHVGVAIAGAVLIGIFLAPLMTSFSLASEALLPRGRRTEGFSWLRISAGVGVSATSLAITFMPVRSTASIIGALLVLAIAAALLAGRPGRPVDEPENPTATQALKDPADDAAVS